MDVQGAIRFPWRALAAATVFAIAWTALMLRHNNVDHQGIDLINHVRMIHQLAVPHGVTEEALGWLREYPHGSHWLGRLFLPLFGNDAIHAIRAASLLVLMVLLISKWSLLQGRMGPYAALLVLLGWQFLCVRARVADVNHFLWEGQYNYARAVGTAALFLLLVTLALPAPRPWQRWARDLAGLALAGYALMCHASPGVIAFVVFGVACLVRFRQGERWPAATQLALAIGLGLFLVFGAGALAMARYAAADGWMPVYGRPFLALWLPTWLAALVALGRQLWRGERGPWSEGVGFALLCGMTASGLLQAWLNVQEWRGACAPYAVKSTLFITFNLTWLTWAFVAAPPLARWWAQRGLALPTWGARYAMPTLAIVLAGLALSIFLHKDSHRPWYGSDRDPITVLRRLRPHHTELAGYYYHDPRQPAGSYLASSLALEASLASLSWQTIHDDGLPALIASGRVRGILLPAGVEEPALKDVPCLVEPMGPFVKYQLVSPIHASVAGLP
jgi:hypothetical protein